eukprot:CAMPEP_0168170314 /NCGR_PEP_ID=MMETSP0139_2-20121125/4111_1 /TAXON_ID=44445 /ORGANISM="Pseudo-nitzschia australis, Strain 10249 10 AB" /LENGTH=1065 /DNA_ID=CAMNT_0008087803 /DNA_START=283 /DNA_END=3480 /DNA_ORIENTATION=+
MNEQKGKKNLHLRSFKKEVLSLSATETTTDDKDDGKDKDNDRKEGSYNDDDVASMSSPTPLSFLSKRLEGLDAPTVWHEFSPLAAKHKSINLGQGFPDWDPPKFLIEELKRSTDPEYECNDVTVTTTANQYARSSAHLPLAEALRNDYADYQWRDSDLPRTILNNLDAATNIATATGVTNVLYCALQGLIDPGDEVLLLEPYFDIYSSQVKLAGGIPVYCPLRSSSLSLSSETTATTIDASEFYTLDLEELASKITSRTKVLILNTPHNPTGKMFSKDELEGIADLVSSKQQQNLVVLADEVYQHIVFDDAKDEDESKQNPHISIATVKRGLIWNQTLTMSSAGKTFSCTGWKVGWAIGPSHLIKAVTAVQQWCNFSPVTPTQDAISRALVLARRPYKGYDSYYEWLAADYGQKRSILIDALENAGRTDTNDSQEEEAQAQRARVFKAVVPNGGFFIMADTSQIEFPYEEIAATQVTSATPRMIVPANEDHENESKKEQQRPKSPPTTKMPRDWALSRWLTTTVGVTAIPPSAFYGPENMHLASNTLRFAFCKNEETLLEASGRMEEHFSTSSLPSSGDDDTDDTAKRAAILEFNPTAPSLLEDPGMDNNSTSTGMPWTSAILRISYDGTKFTGWSAANRRNNGSHRTRPRRRSRRRGFVEEFYHGKLPAGFVRSVEGILKENLARLYGNVDPNTRIVVEGCSRTDKGVHATSMIAQVYCLKEGFSTTRAGSSSEHNGENESENENDNGEFSSIKNNNDSPVGENEGENENDNGEFSSINNNNDSPVGESSMVIPGKRIPHPATPTDDSCFEVLPMGNNLSRIAYCFNKMRPSDIQVTGIAPTPRMEQGEVFHASQSTKSKTYEYQLSTGYLVDPTQRKATWHAGSSSDFGLDVAKIQQACAILLGRHDFSAFRGAARGASERRKRITKGDNDDDSNCICTIYDLKIELQDPIGIHEDYYFPRVDPPVQNYKIVVRGDRFLYKMVRFLVGSLVAMGNGTLELGDIERAIETGSWEIPNDPSGRRKEFQCAPAHGLTLVRVDYGEEISFDWQPLRDPTLGRRNKQR